ncbi:MAG: hypothetical protein ACRENP_00675 [Longimicrobiales bacterium]
MRSSALILSITCVALMGSARPGSAQFAVRAKAGTTGIGGDVSFSVIPRIALRVGATMMPVKPEGTFSDVTYQVALPSPLFTAGADLYLLGGVRLIGGLLIGAQHTDITGIYSGSANIGGQQYNGAQLGQLLGRVSAKNVAPYVGLGFGKTVGPGIGLSFDLGGAFLGPPTLDLSATGTCTNDAQCNAVLQPNLDREAADIQTDLERYARIFPMISVGVRFGFGG